MWPGEVPDEAEFARAKPSKCMKLSDAIDLEAPFCLQASAPTIRALADLLMVLLQQAADPASPAAEHAHVMCASVLQLLTVNFVRLSFAHVDPVDVGIMSAHDSGTLMPLLEALLQVWHVSCADFTVACMLNALLCCAACAARCACARNRAARSCDSYFQWLRDLVCVTAASRGFHWWANYKAHG